MRALKEALDADLITADEYAEQKALLLHQMRDAAALDSEPSTTTAAPTLQVALCPCRPCMPLGLMPRQECV